MSLAPGWMSSISFLQPATFDLEAVRDAATIMDDEAHRSRRDRSRGQLDFPFRQLHLDLGGRWSAARCGQCDKVERQCDKRHGNIPLTGSSGCGVRPPDMTHGAMSLFPALSC